MPNSILIPTAQNLPDGFCPTSWQATVNAFAAAMRVTLPTSASQIIVQATTPGPEFNDYIWFQEDVNGQILSIRSWNSATNAWERVDEEQYYFNDIGTTNAIEINSSNIIDAVSSLSDIVGRLLIIKVANANSATTVTIELDGLAATPVKVYGSQSLAVGNIQAGMICAFIYDGTNFQLLNPKYIPPANSYVTYHSESPTFSVPAQGSAQEWSHGLTGMPTYYDCYLVCQNAALGGGASVDLGYAVGDRVHWSQAEAGGSNQEFPALSLCSDTTKLKLVSVTSTYQFFYLLHKSTGGLILADPTKWSIVFVASKLVAA